MNQIKRCRRSLSQRADLKKDIPKLMTRKEMLLIFFTLALFGLEVLAGDYNRQREIRPDCPLVLSCFAQAYETLCNEKK